MPPQWKTRKFVMCRNRTDLETPCGRWHPKSTGRLRWGLGRPPWSPRAVLGRDVNRCLCGCCSSPQAFFSRTNTNDSSTLMSVFSKLVISNSLKENNPSKLIMCLFLQGKHAETMAFNGDVEGKSPGWTRSLWQVHRAMMRRSFQPSPVMAISPHTGLGTTVSRRTEIGGYCCVLFSTNPRGWVWNKGVKFLKSIITK